MWDGINPNIAVRQLAMNFRFAAVGGGADLYEPAAMAWSGGAITKMKRGTGPKRVCSTDAG